MLELIKKRLIEAFSFSQEDVERQSMLTNLRTVLNPNTFEKHKDFFKGVSNEELEQLILLAQYGANVDEMISCYKESKGKGITFLMLRKAQVLAMDLEVRHMISGQKLREFPPRKP